MGNINEQLLDLLLKRDLLLQRVSNGLSKEVALYYTDLIKQAINTIKDYDEITIVKMNKLIKEINSRIEFNYEEQLSSKFQELGVVEATYIPTAINGLIGVNIVDKLLPEPLIERIINNSILPDGHFVKDAFDILTSNFKNNIKANIQKQVHDDIQSGILNGTPASKIVNNLKPIFEDLTKNKIDSLVKTSISSISNNVRMEVYKENEDIFKGYQHQSVLDFRTTPECVSRDNAEWDLNGKPLNKRAEGKQFKNVPIHWRCRSNILPIIKSFRELGIDLDDVRGLTRSSLNGEVPREMNYEQWFDNQSEKDKEKYLGKGRFELYKDGKITLSDLVSQKGKVLTIKELKALS